MHQSNPQVDQRESLHEGSDAGRTRKKGRKNAKPFVLFVTFHPKPEFVRNFPGNSRLGAGRSEWRAGRYETLRAAEQAAEAIRAHSFYARHAERIDTRIEQK